MARSRRGGGLVIGALALAALAALGSGRRPEGQPPAVHLGLPDLQPNSNLLRLFWLVPTDFQRTPATTDRIVEFWREAREWFEATTGMRLRWDTTVYIAPLPWTEAEGLTMQHFMYTGVAWAPAFAEIGFRVIGGTSPFGQGDPAQVTGDTWLVLAGGMAQPAFGARWGSPPMGTAFTTNIGIYNILARDPRPMWISWHEIGHAAWGFDHSPPGSVMFPAGVSGAPFDPVAHLPVIAASKYFDGFV